MVAASKYETIRPIASGGMATVYLGRILGRGGFQRLVAIKRMHPHFAQNADFVAMFLDEARLAASIHHPNVVGTIDIDEGEEGLYLVMEFVDGASLSRLSSAFKKRGERIPIPIVLRVMIDALNGLQAAHELTSSEGQPLHLVHRDVSPQNILVGGDGVARITDFGVARAEARLTSTSDGSMKGKLSYMPPEQIRGESSDARADIYAAGVVLWEMLVGTRLFVAGDNSATTMREILRGASAAPSAHVPVPPALDAVVMASIALDREDRFASASAFAEALAEAAAHARIPIASPRQVGEMVREISPPVRISPEPATGSLSNASVSVGVPSARTAAVVGPPPNHSSPYGPPQSYPAASVPHPASLTPPGSGPYPSQPNTSSLSGHQYSHVNAGHPVATSRSSGALVAGVAIAGALLLSGAGVWFFASSRLAALRAAETSSTAPAIPVAASAASGVPAISPEPPPPPVATTAVATAAPSADVAPSASPTTTVRPRVVTRPAPAPHPSAAPAPPASASPARPGGKFHPLDP